MLQSIILDVPSIISLLRRDKCILCLPFNNDDRPLNNEIWVKEDWSIINNNVIYRTDKLAMSCELWCDATIMSVDKSRLTLNAYKIQKGVFSDNMINMDGLIVSGMCDNGPAWFYYFNIIKR